MIIWLSKESLVMLFSPQTRLSSGISHPRRQIWDNLISSVLRVACYFHLEVYPNLYFWNSVTFPENASMWFPFMNSIASNFEEHTLHSYDLAVVYKPSKFQSKVLNQSLVSCFYMLLLHVLYLFLILKLLLQWNHINSWRIGPNCI